VTWADSVPNLNPDTIHHAIRDITKHTRGGMQLRWKMERYKSPPRPSGTSRNLLGFKDGTANPTGTLASGLVWLDDPAEPGWARGGSYQVVRLIRMLVEFWDRVSINEQENMFGLCRDSGAPLDGTSEFDTPDYTADPHGWSTTCTRSAAGTSSPGRACAARPTGTAGGCLPSAE
jgi:deferrochelatase/peroxidase EfeB